MLTDSGEVAVGESAMSCYQALSFSGGWQSSVLAWMAIRGEIVLPRYFLIGTADTGDERQRTYDYIETVSSEAKKTGIAHIIAPGPKITEDWNEEFDGKRVDTAPYWTKDENGKIGQLSQQCTRHYKIRPVRRAVTQWLINGIKPRMRRSEAQRVPVVFWIGFASDEQHRASKILSDTPRFTHRFPLIELGMTKQDCVDYIRDNQLPEPIASVCAGCFSNGLKTLRWMYENDKAAWERTVARDRYVRNGLAKYGVRDQVYVFSGCVPIEELPERNFRLETTKETAKHECASGVCFV